MADINKVSDYVWRIDKSGDMNVPAVIFASEKMLGKMRGDRTLTQLTNVATLPGIVRSAYVMPDGHEGYGFPIGGVAAFREEEGIVSPGGVGYDINCILPGAHILSSFGFFRPIEAYSAYFSEVAHTGGTVLLTGSHELVVGSEKGRATFFMHKEFEGQVYTVETLSGTVTVTPDHPIITPTGRKLPADLSEGGTILTYPFEGVEYELFCENEEEIAIYAKLIGYLTGDGTLTYSNRKMRAIFFGKKEDLARIRDDVAKLGYHSHIIERIRAHSINGKRFTATNAELHVYSQEFARRLIELGAPVGNKTNVRFRVPPFVRTSPLWIKRLYLAALFGAELSAPATSSKTGFYMPTLNMNKAVTLESNAREFLFDLSELLGEFGVNIAKVSKVECVNGKVRLRLEVDGDEENLLKLYTRIGYEYNTKRMVAGLAAVLYIRMKAMYRAKREEVRARVCELKSKGFRLSELQERFASKWANARFIERAYYENTSARAPLSLPSFDEFLAMQVEAYNTFGALVDEIITIGKKGYSGRVYDFNVESHHRFVANGIIVSNCGVRVIKTNLKYADVAPKLRDLVNSIFENCPSGVGSEGKVRLDTQTLKQVLSDGVDWAIRAGYGWERDKEFIEEYGHMKDADPSKVSDTALKRGRPQLGTVGSGNHFIELQEVQDVFDENIASKFGLFKGQFVIMIHTGSRGLGHQVASDYIRIFNEYIQRNNIRLADRELVYAPVNSPEGQDYIKAMNCAVNYAFVNRQMLTHWVREAVGMVFKKDPEDLGMDVLYDVCHNIAKREEHVVEDGRKGFVWVHRKGATRAMPAGRSEVPTAYRDVGQPVLIPGSMGTASYVLVGTPESAEAFHSVCHGAGRVMSRHDAIREYPAAQVRASLENKGIYVRVAERELISEEAPGAYKDIDDVIESVKGAHLANPVVRMVPHGVVKG